VFFIGNSTGKSAAEKKAARTPTETVVVPAFQKLFAEWVEEFKALPIAK
jgi:hypothetical protein